MSLKNSGIPREDSNQQRIRISKRRETSPATDEAAKKSMSMSIAEAFEHEKAMAQAYRQKNERNMVKCKFLYNKLTTLGNLEGVPQMIASEVSELDEKIKELESILSAKRTLQMRNLRRKVNAFLQQISFEIQAEDLEKLQDEIEIILFLIDIFEEKFKEMTAERKEIDEIIARLQRQNAIDPLAESVQVKKAHNELKKQNQRLHLKLMALQNELQKSKVEENKGQHEHVRYENTVEEAINTKNLQLQKQSKYIEDIENELSEVKAKLKVVETDLQRSKREEVRLKERYRVMEAQKNQRIKLLQQGFNRG